MANKVTLKRSSVAAKVPTTTDLDLGELAINTYDGKLYLKKDNGTESVVQIGGILSLSQDNTPTLSASLDCSGYELQNVGGISNVGIGELVFDPDGASTGTTSFYGDLVCDGSVSLGTSVAVKVGSAGISARTTNGDLNLAGNGTGKVKVGPVKMPSADGSTNQVLRTDGSGQLEWVTISTGGLGAVDEDTSPTLGGDLNTDGHSIIDASSIALNQGSGSTVLTVQNGEVAVSGDWNSSGAGRINAPFISGDFIFSASDTEMQLGGYYTPGVGWSGGVGLMTPTTVYADMTIGTDAKFNGKHYVTNAVGLTGSATSTNFLNMATSSANAVVIIEADVGVRGASGAYAAFKVSAVWSSDSSVATIRSVQKTIIGRSDVNIDIDFAVANLGGSLNAFRITAQGTAAENTTFFGTMTWYEVG
jgi:hypothetical protein